MKDKLCSEYDLKSLRVRKFGSERKDLEETRQLQALIEQKLCNHQKSGAEFLMSIAGIGSSDAEDISERDEEILQAEIN